MKRQERQGALPIRRTSCARHARNKGASRRTGANQSKQSTLAFLAFQSFFFLLRGFA
jgi:hypothetical protein